MNTKTKTIPNHILYRNGDDGIPDAICDAQGCVVLELCKICHRGEIELTEPCVHTVDDWAKIDDMRIVDYDGFRDLQKTDLISKPDFDQRAIYCTRFFKK